MHLRNYIDHKILEESETTEAIVGRNRSGMKKYLTLSDGELTSDKLNNFLEMCGYEYIGFKTGAELLRKHLGEKVYAMDRSNILVGLSSFKIVVAEDIYYITLPYTGSDNVLIKRHSHPFGKISIEDAEKAILDNA